jgi:dUTP pyrophosphatase
MTRSLIKTGIAIEIPEGFYGRIAPRSGLALKHGIDVLAGVIDSSYRGEIGVVLFNTDQNQSFSIKAGDRIAQLIIERHYNFPWVRRTSLGDSNRSNNGFGSSGI